MTMTEAEARARKSERQRERRMAQPGYGHGPGLTVAEREARREAYLGLLAVPEGHGWRERAACRGASPALFSEPDSAEGSPGESGGERERREAARAPGRGPARPAGPSAGYRVGRAPPSRRCSGR